MQTAYVVVERGLRDMAQHITVVGAYNIMPANPIVACNSKLALCRSFPHFDDMLL